jgi:hypothetical protein
MVGEKDQEDRTIEAVERLADNLGSIADHVGIDNETVAWGLFSIANAIDRLADAISVGTKTVKQPPRNK